MVKYVAKIQRVNTLSLGIKTTIIDDTHSKTLMLEDLLKKPLGIAL
jgi:hypothetical protein